jgi:hypothetical protein
MLEEAAEHVWIEIVREMSVLGIRLRQIFLIA